jgi:hypothetical protein
MSEMAEITPIPVDGSAVAPLEAAPRSASGELLAYVTSLLASTAHDQAQEDALNLLDAVVRRAAGLVGRSDWASITVLRQRTLRTLASSHDEALQADTLQYDLRSGPCVDAAVDDAVYLTGDIRSDERWPQYGPRVHARLGVRSVLAYRLQLLGDDSADAALNIYATQGNAFDDEAVRDGMLLATQCALLVSAHLANDRAENLVQALGTNREIGVAMGVLMYQHHVSRDEAFGMLRVASQDSNRKLIDVATQVADTGELPLRRLRRGPA